MTIEERAKTIELKRKILGLRREELAKKCGITKQTMSNIALGKSCISTIMLVEYVLAEYFRTWSPFDVETIED